MSNKGGWNFRSYRRRNDSLLPVSNGEFFREIPIKKKFFRESRARAQATMGQTILLPLQAPADNDSTLNVNGNAFQCRCAGEPAQYKTISLCASAPALWSVTTLHACQWRAWRPPTPNLFAVPHLSSCDSLSASRLTDSWYEMESRCCRILVRLCGICHISTTSSSLACTFFCFFSLYYTPAKSFEFVSFFLFFTFL